MLIFEHLVNKCQLLDPYLKIPVKVSIHGNKMNPISYPAVKVLVLPTKRNWIKAPNILHMPFEQ